MNSKLLRNGLFSLIVLGFFYYAYRYILASSFVIDGQRFYVLFDDAMISMRYAYNLVHGNGLVWNAGDRVEGFTNPLWVIYMALFHLLPIPLSQMSLPIQVSGAVFLAANLFFVRRIVEYFTDNLPAMLGAVVFTAFYAPLISWGLLGMEVSILALILTAAVWLILRNGLDHFDPWIYVLMAVSTLFRFDMAVPYLVILAVMFIVQKQYRKQNLLWGLGLLVLFLGGQTVARFIYYGQPLPNTYYLKVEGWPFSLRILRGLYALVWFMYYNNWVLFLLPLAIFFFRRDWKVTLLIFVIMGQLVYSVYVGGDAWEDHGGANRYIAISMPVYFAAFVIAVDLLRQKAVAVFNSTNLAVVVSRLAWVILFVTALINFNLLVGDWKSIERWDLVRRPDYVAGGDHNLQIALALQKTTKPGASIAVVGAGTSPYLLPYDYAIDILGKADTVIAHEKVRTPMSIEDVPTMRPGHMKWDYAHTFGELKPDVIVSLWEGTTQEAAPYLTNYVYATLAQGVKVYLRKDSTNVLWDQVIIPK
jgi:arabinofuranosyltransferase